MSSNHLKDHYQQEIVPELTKAFGLSNRQSVARLEKIVVSMGIGEGTLDKGVIEKPSQDLATITGQKPKIAAARVSVAGFHLRQGAPVGLAVTLRGKRMFAFFEKLTTIVLPRLRDFQGVSRKSFDGRGNYNLGLTELIVFPEVEFSRDEKTRGLQITFVTSTNDDRQAEKLLELMGMPFEKEEGDSKQ